jgi:hypothetical protein
MTAAIRGVRGRAATLATSALLATLALSGCGWSGSGSSPGSGSKDGAPVALNSDGTVPKPLSTLTRQVGDYDITVDIAQLHRYDKVTRVQLTVTPRSRGTSDKLPARFFSERYNNDLSGVYLLDTANLKRYPVLRADKSICVCSRELVDFTLDAPTLLFADFPQVPPDVKQISLVVPRLGPLPAAEIS